MNKTKCKCHLNINSVAWEEVISVHFKSFFYSNVFSLSVLCVTCLHCSCPRSEGDVWTVGHWSVSVGTSLQFSHCGSEDGESVHNTQRCSGWLTSPLLPHIILLSSLLFTCSCMALLVSISHWGKQLYRHYSSGIISLILSWNIWLWYQWKCTHDDDDDYDVRIVWKLIF